MSEAAVTQEALRLAIRMEIEGRKFYLEAVRHCGNEPGKKLFRSLAREENDHRRDFEKIYESLRNKYEWPVTEIVAKTTRRKLSYPAGLTPQTCPALPPAEGELEAVKTAIKMENESYDFYRKQTAHATYPGEKEFYEALSAAENVHRLALVDYLEFLSDPAAYFVNKEHPTLD
jgi:rubrerythrin